jgi:ribonucleoside-diphosphate reductase alpha chain
VSTAAISENARVVLEHRYLAKNAADEIVETPEGMFRRVAHAIAEVDREREGPSVGARWEEAYFHVMSDLLFLPNSPTLMNAGTELGQLAACFVLPVGDSIAEIFEAVRQMAIIHQTGGGTGFSFSHLRPRGDPVRETGGVASGPVSFMRVFDVATEVVKLGGRRRGANMGVLDVSHPDIVEFVTAKAMDATALTNFNLSVAVPDAFLRAVKTGDGWPLVNPRTGRTCGHVRSAELWSRICEAAWQRGDPGVLFIDEINRHNPLPALGRIAATNPCGEQPLLSYEACNLGSINLARLVGPAGPDWPRLRETVVLAVRFLDNVIDACRYPLHEIEALSHANRKIGLGVMGLAEALAITGIPYASREALGFARRVMQTVTESARQASIELAKRRGSFPNCDRSVWPALGIPSIRNATLTTIAPTGTLSLIAGTSSGIEPFFGLAYTRNVLDGTELQEVSPCFLTALQQADLDASAIVAEVASTGSIQHVAGVPDELKRRFETAFDIPAEWHIRMQAAVQRHTDNAVSKTVNLPESATVEDVRRLFELAWRLHCKGVTVFRYGSREGQVLEFGRMPSFVVGPDQARAHAEYVGECRLCSI